MENQSEYLSVFITGSVQDATGFLTGIVRMERSEAERLINLRVAKLAEESPEDIQVYEFSGNQDDAPADTQVDASADVQDDAPADTQVDASADVQGDAPADIQGDAPAEAQDDAPAEVQADVEIDNQVDNRVNSEVGEVIISDTSNTKEKIDDKTPKKSAAHRRQRKQRAVKQA